MFCNLFNLYIIKAKIYKIQHIKVAKLITNEQITGFIQKITGDYCSSK